MPQTPNISENLLSTHFILCTERTGSSLLSLILNLHPQILSPSEEPFALYFYKSYKHKVVWTDKELQDFINEFWLIAEKSLELFFTSKENLLNALSPYKNNLPYDKLVNIIYQQFVEPKPKDKLSLIVDKQIKYFFYLKELIKLFPNSKFIILVLDPRVNAQRKKLRNLNAGTSAIYLSALWRNTYKNIYYLKKHERQIKIVKYEDLVANPESTIKGLCEFMDVPYTHIMLETEGMYEKFLEIQKNKINKEHVDYLKDFHSGLFTKINTEKISLKENEIDETVNNKIIHLCSDLLKEFKYDINSTGNGKLNVNDYLQILKAYLYRPLLIRMYLHIPLGIKLVIKKIRKP